MPKYIERYIEGEFENVWTELQQLGPAVREEPLYSDAMAVALETMRRVDWNTKKIISRLEKINYQFGFYRNNHKRVEGYKLPHNPPSLINLRKRNSIIKGEIISDIIPLSLLAFWEIVGDIDFTGWHPSFPAYSDPLVVFPVDTIKASYDNIQECHEENNKILMPLKLFISPDYLHKDNISGGEGYEMTVPNAAMDGLLENEQHNTTFINYLRISFRFGGFAGINSNSTEISDLLESISMELLPI